VKDLINCNQKFQIQEASADNTFLYEILYLSEKTSEHPIAVSICSQIAKNLGNEEQIPDKYTAINFKNRNGEGVVSTICVKD
jgi:cation transport ATPase